jgi:hypothetical protein
VRSLYPSYYYQCPLPRILGDVVRLGYLMMSVRKYNRMAVDTGMVVVIFISMMYIVLVFGLLFYVKNDWCDLLFKNMMVSEFDSSMDFS